MKQKTSFFQRIPILSGSLLISLFAASLFYSSRTFWVFYSPNLSFIGGSMGIFIISLMSLAVIFVMLALRLFAKESVWQKKTLCVLCAAAEIIGAIILLADLAIIIFGGREVAGLIWEYFLKDLPIVIAFAVVSILLFAYPRVKKKAVLAVCLVICLSVGAFFQIFPFGSYRFTSEPVVMDTGEEYSVVFSTNDNGTAFVRYTFEGKERTVYAEKQGRRIGNRKLHSVQVPYEHLENSSYEIGSTRVIEQFGYGSRLGKTITSGPFKFKTNKSEKQTYLVLSDWHTYTDDAKKAVSNLGEYDAVVMLGDPAGSMDFEAQAITNVVQFGSELTHGQKPVIYVRGNHETRGEFAADFPEYLGYDKMYYSVKRGEYNFMILDSCEDKEDAHIEYGGMDDYAAHRLEMLDWLNGQTSQGDKLIVFSHAWQVSEPEPDVSRAAWDKLQQLGARFMLSGHTHTCEFLDDDNPEAKEYLAAYPDITTYIDGGHKGDTYTASKLTLTKQGVHIEAADNSGNKVIDKSFKW